MYDGLTKEVRYLKNQVLPALLDITKIHQDGTHGRESI
jgi:hypothetical protein